ncbi:MAG TPA: carboxypeptidase-like regulatory domain-containing protein [Pirellulaceae bacterium]|nr:carboxypeptidase-like regulatory domain-containing protein [Pirellulaceae bacterium]
MKGYLIVRDDPYAAISDEAGDFQIRNLPAGNWTLRVWQERTGFVEDVHVQGKATKWLKGQVDVVIEDGKTFDFGEIKVAPREFQEK